MGLREEGEAWRDGGDLVQVFNSHFKSRMERISMYSMYAEECNINKCRRFSANVLWCLDTYTYVHSDMHTYAIGKAGVNGVSQGRQRLRALIDCSNGVHVPRPHLSVCQRTLQGQ